MIWRYLLHTRYGLINFVLAKFGFAPIDWLGDPHWSMPAIILFAVWKNFGYNMIIVLAALQGIPHELYEAAHIDGASLWQRLRFITLPMLKPALLLVSVITVSGYFQLFAEPYVMTLGGPVQSTESVLYFMYEEGFMWWSLGRASAIAFLLFALISAQHGCCCAGDGAEKRCERLACADDRGACVARRARGVRAVSAHLDALGLVHGGRAKRARCRRRCCRRAPRSRTTASCSNAQVWAAIS